jgi:hypothetical protein
MTEVNNPANSDHLGISLDINIEQLFGGTYSTLSTQPRRKLTLKNIQAKLNYISYITNQWKLHNYYVRAQKLHQAMLDGKFNASNLTELQQLDKEVTQTLLTGEDQCATRDIQRNPWTPTLCEAGLQLSYWKRKLQMSQNKHFRWHILASLYERTNITLEDHQNIDPESIKQHLRIARRTWREVKKQGDELRQQFLQDQAEEHARRHNIVPAKALKAIKQAEASRQTYAQINELIGGKKTKNPLTQIEIMDPSLNNKATTTLITQEQIESAIIQRNQRHARQSLQTPFSTIPELAEAINPANPANKIENIVKGDFIDTLPENIPLSLAERQWISELQRQIDTEIEIHIGLQDFINFFKNRKEKTASSHSGRHFGHYKVIAQMAEDGTTEVAETLLLIINTSIATSSPLERWKHSSQLMIEKGKGKYIENLRIIQLCEADLNFALNILWGNRMIRTALKNHALDESQYAIPGQTCNSAVWNKALYCDLLRQTLQPGILTDYDATAAFDRVLHAMTIVTCRRLGMPQTACLFIFNLLHNMEFHVITGLGQSKHSFTNNEDPVQPGQGVLQGSSSAAPIYNVNSDVSLTTYNKLATGAEFTHPITKETFQDFATQYVDDKTDMVNIQGITNLHQHTPRTTHHSHLFEHANRNSNLWAELQWLSGGDLNHKKCFSYYIDPQYDFKTDKIRYTSKSKAPGEILMKNPATKEITPIAREEPQTARRTLGVHLAPNGSSTTQTKISIEKAETFLGKMKHSNISQQAKWKAITTVLSPGVLYPLAASLCSKKELDRIEQVLARAKCNALGLNEHFPRAILYGPNCYGGLQIPSTHASTTIERINYFLYHIRTSTKVEKKLETSLAFLQLETGLMQPFLASSYESYGSLATTTLLKCLWAQTEPFGLFLQPDTTTYWLPKLQGLNDIAIMEDVRTFYNMEDSIKINRCRLYFQVITLYDLITYDGTQIHPDYTSNNRVQSRKSLIHWVDFNKPSKKNFTLWNEYISMYVAPRIKNNIIKWNRDTNPHYNNTYYTLSYNGRLYHQMSPDTYHIHEATHLQPMNRNSVFHIKSNITQPNTDEISYLRPVDVTHSKQHIKILCYSDINSHGTKPAIPI